MSVLNVLAIMSDFPFYLILSIFSLLSFCDYKANVDHRITVSRFFVFYCVKTVNPLPTEKIVIYPFQFHIYRVDRGLGQIIRQFATK